MPRRLLTRGPRLVLLVAAAAGAGIGATYVPDGLRTLELFEIRSVDVEGTTFLRAEEAVRVAAVRDGANLWDEPDAWERRLAAHPLVRSVRTRRRLPSTLVLVVEERVPVGLVPTPTLVPIDADGRTLPIDPAEHALDLPLLEVPGKRAIEPLARATARLARLDPGFADEVATVALDDAGDLVVGWRDPVTVRMPADVAAARLRGGVRALEEAERRSGEAALGFDLRFADQVVVRLR